MSEEGQLQADYSMHLAEAMITDLKAACPLGPWACSMQERACVHAHQRHIIHARPFAWQLTRWIVVFWCHIWLDSPTAIHVLANCNSRTGQVLILDGNRGHQCKGWPSDIIRIRDC